VAIESPGDELGQELAPGVFASACMVRGRSSLARIIRK
jgi:hypothetical protein